MSVSECNEKQSIDAVVTLVRDYDVDVIVYTTYYVSHLWFIHSNLELNLPGINVTLISPIFKFKFVEDRERQTEEHKNLLNDVKTKCRGKKFSLSITTPKMLFRSNAFNFLEFPLSHLKTCLRFSEYVYQLSNSYHEV